MENGLSPLKRSIPALDGLRAVAVSLVIVDHLHVVFNGRSEYFLFPIRDGQLGVAVFFVISGFLITSLLLNEDNQKGKISLASFYIRRAFRILPPFYAFLAVIWIRSNLLHIDPIPKGDFISALLYTWNYNIHSKSIVLSHLWSLSLEEQFYLLWPWCLVFFDRKNCLRIALALVVLSPLSRVLSYWLMPDYRTFLGKMLHTRIDTIMIGCLLALVLDLGIQAGVVEKIRHSGLLAAIALIVLPIDTYLWLRFGGGWSLTVGITLQGLCCAVILLYCISQRDNLVARLLNNRVIRHVGVISYGLYLWQQLFAFDEKFGKFPLNLLWILACAELSYFLVERPSYRVRDKVLGWLTKPAGVKESH